MNFVFDSVRRNEVRVTIRFIHTSDWQIGKPFRNFDARVAGKLEAARVSVIDRIASIAGERKVRHVLVAGDVYDGDAIPHITLMQPVHRMMRAAHVTWWLLPGNHDPAHPQGVWQRLKNEGLPDNVRVLDTSQPVEMEPAIWLLPAPLFARSVSEDPTAWMDQAETPAGAIRIGLSHGSVRGFGSAQESAVSIDAGRASKAKLDYLALGDWHGKRNENARTWYSGTPEPDRFPENEPGSVLVVDIEAAGVQPRVEAVESASFIWAKLAYQISGIEDLAAIERQISELADDPGRLILRLGLAGRIALQEISAVEGWCANLEAKLQYLKADLSELLPVCDGDFALFSESNELAQAAEYLSAIAADDNDARQGTAAVALTRLAALTRQEAAGDR